MNINFENFKNLFFILYLLTKHSIKYIYYRDSLKLVKDICNEIESFNVTYIKIIQGICVNSIIFNNTQKDYLQKYTNQVPYTITEKNESILNNLENEGVEFFSREPINAGIIALVYKGKYKKNEVVIKVLKQGIDKKLKSAIKDLYLLGQIISFIPFVKNLNLIDFIKDNSKVIWDQIDFKNELKNINYWLEFSNKVDYLEIPNVYSDITNKYNNVLVMNFIKGIDVNKITNIEKYNYAKILAKINFIASFFYGIGHSDLHIGNIMFSENKIGLIDFGIGYKIGKLEQDAIYKFYKYLFIENNTYKAATCLKTLTNSNEKFDNLKDSEKESLLVSQSKIIEQYYCKDPDVVKFVYYSNKLLSKYDLRLGTSLNQVVFGISSGINLSLSLINATSYNPNKEYNNFILPIIEDLLKETEFTLD